jgi:hypothetical protein
MYNTVCITYRLHKYVFYFIHLNTFSEKRLERFTRLSKGIHRTKRLIIPGLSGNKKYEGLCLVCFWYMCKKNREIPGNFSVRVQEVSLVSRKWNLLSTGSNVTSCTK